MKIIYIHPSQLSKRWLQYYCLDDLQNIFDIEYWDCSAIAKPGFKAIQIEKRPYLISINSTNDFIINLKRIPKDSLIVNDMHLNAGNYHLYMLLAKYFQHRIYINFFANTQGAYKNKILSKLASSSIKDIICYFLIKKKFKFYILSSKQNSKRKTYRINHPDYEQYKEIIKTYNPQYESDYVVYIDNYFPFHPEIKKREPNFNPTNAAPLFYNSLNSFFGEIEKSYKCKVIIAAHPSSCYETNPFNGRTIIYNQTCELIKNCKAVCMHTSNALSYAILFNKPIALLANTGFRQSQLEYKRLNNIAKQLSLDITDTDKLLNIKSIFKFINNNFSSSYKRIYLIGNEHKNNTELFIEYFNEIYKTLYLKNNRK